MCTVTNVKGELRYSVHLFTKYGEERLLLAKGKDEMDALRNYAAERNLYEGGWIIESMVFKGPCLRCYDNEGNCKGEIHLEISPYQPS